MSGGDTFLGVKVALSGAHGTGKTTLARALNERLGLHELPTPGRLMAAEGLPINERATVVSQALAWTRQMRLEEERSSWVAMRSLVDVWAYAREAAERSPVSALDEALLRELTELTRRLTPSRYDALYYLPPRIPLESDGVRSSDPEFQAAIDQRIRCALAEWRLEYFEVDITERDALQGAFSYLENRLSASEESESSD